MHIQTEDPKFVRDANSNALLNKDVDGYRVFKQMQVMNKQINSLQKTIEMLQQQVININNRIAKLENHG